MKMATYDSSGRQLIRLFDVEHVKEFVFGAEYYMDIINELFLCYALDMEKPVKACPMYRRDVKRKMNVFFERVRRHDYNLITEIRGDYGKFVAEMHDQMDEYIQEDILKLENAVYMSLSGKGFPYPDIIAKLYTCLMLVHYANIVHQGYCERMNAVNRRLKGYYRMFDPEQIEGALRLAYEQFCYELRVAPSNLIAEDTSVNNGWKIVDMKLNDTDAICRIIDKVKIYTENV